MSKTGCIRLAVACWACAVGAIDASEIALVPVSSDSNFVLSSVNFSGANEIFVQQGAQVTIHIEISGWGDANAANELRAYQFRILPAGYTSGTTGSLSPLTDPDASAGAFIDAGNPNFVHDGFTAFPSVDTSSPATGYRWASATASGGPTDQGSAKYAGTLILDVSPDATGSFLIDLDTDGLQTFLTDQNSQDIAIDTLRSALISVVPSCTFATGSTCRVPPTVGGRVSDLDDGVMIADDFAATGTTINNVCWWGSYSDSDGIGCGPTADSFTIAFFDDAGGRAGTLISSQSVTPIRDIASEQMSRPMYSYSATLTTSVNVAPGTKYWISIVNDTSGAPANCNWSWSLGGTTPTGNSFSEEDRNGTFGISDRFLATDWSFCLDSGISAGDGGTVQGACCDCGLNQCADDSLIDCVTGGGSWKVGETCVVGTCDPPANDDCATLVTPIGEGSTPFSNICATTDGPANLTCELGASPFAFDVWYSYVAEGDGSLDIGTCGDLTYDNILAVYSDGTGTCPCPTDATFQVDCSDEGCNGILDGGGGLISLSASSGVCYLIRAGGFGGQGSDVGGGAIELTFDCACETDVANDGSSNVSDIFAIVDCANGAGCGSCINSCDVNCDGTVDYADAAAVDCAFMGGSSCCSQTVGACTGASGLNAGPCEVTTESFCTGFQLNGTYEGDGTICPVILFVDGDATGTGDGSSWTDAYPTLAGALADAEVIAGNVTEIWVAEGTYKPDEGGGQTPGDRHATFQMRSGLGLYGGFTGTETERSERDPAANVTILSGDIGENDTTVACTQNSPDCDSNGGLCDQGACIVRNNISENSWHVVTASNVIDGTMDGFTITAGNGDQPGLAWGGGMQIGFAGGGEGPSDPLIANCTFTWNSADNGGAIYNTGGALNAAVIRDCVFRGNHASFSGGGAVKNNGSSDIVRCTFVANSATGAQGSGGAVAAGGSTQGILNSTFFGNRATVSAGALSIGDTAADVINCVFSGNATAGTGGGAIVVSSSSGPAPVFANCTLRGNTALAGSGGGIFVNTGTGQTSLANCILWGNSDAGGTDESAQIHTFGGTPTVNWSLIQGGWTGAGGFGNLSVDPLFVAPLGADLKVGTLDDNLRLRPGSPAIDTGDDISNLETTDLDGNPRKVDDPKSPNASKSIIDMGAYEYPDITRYYVDASAGSGGIGTSWAQAFQTLQEALSAAVLGDQIWVAAGTYTPGTTRTSSFSLVDGVKVYGGFAGGEADVALRDPSVNETILSGEIGTPADFSDNTYHVVRAVGTGAGTLIDSFTIERGNANGTGDQRRGGGLFVSGSLTIGQCRFVDNQAAGEGGGIFSLAPSLPISGCEFDSNDAIGNGGGLFFAGGSGSVLNCRFDGNTANAGGAIVVKQSGTAPVITQSVFVGNFASTTGGAILVRDATALISSCALADNSGSVAGDAIYTIGTTRPTVTNSILWGSATQIAGDVTNGALVNHSNVDGGIFTGQGNISADPLFVNRPLGDLRLIAGSPCIDAGKNASAVTTLDFDGNPRRYDDAATTDTGTGTVPIVDMGAYEFFDCNGNGTPDDQDIANVTSLDCNANDVPDECEPEDCDDDDIPDECEVSLAEQDCNGDGVCNGVEISSCGANPECTDCQSGGAGNGIPDFCDIRDGTSADCTAGTAILAGQGIPDECEPDCQNAGAGNGVADSCDILNGTSEDCNTDGIPDECQAGSGIDCIGTVSSGDWSETPTWEGDDVPQNEPGGNESAEIGTTPPPLGLQRASGQTVVNLDIDVEVDTVRILGDGVLNVNATTPEGDLTLAQAGGMLVFGELRVAESRVIDSSIGQVTFGPGGSYQKVSGAGNTSATLQADTLTITGGTPLLTPGTVELTDDMVVTADDVILDGSDSDTSCSSGAALRGGVSPPPKLTIRSLSHLDAHSFKILNSAELTVGSSDPLAGDAPTVRITGDFLNESKDACQFNWHSGELILDGGTPEAPLYFEAAGRDVGPCHLVSTTQVIWGRFCVQEPRRGTATSRSAT